MLNNRYTQSKIFRKADNAYEVSKIVLFVFWMPIIVMTILSLVMN